jgi:hypothetical protein
MTITIDAAMEIIADPGSSDMKVGNATRKLVNALQSSAHQKFGSDIRDLARPNNDRRVMERASLILRAASGSVCDGK